MLLLLAGKNQIVWARFVRLNLNAKERYRNERARKGANRFGLALPRDHT